MDTSLYKKVLFTFTFEVTFLKCSQKSVIGSRFAIPDEEDIVDVPFGDIIARLPAPNVIGRTTHTEKMGVFSVYLSQYRPR